MIKYSKLLGRVKLIQLQFYGGSCSNCEIQSTEELIFGDKDKKNGYRSFKIFCNHCKVIFFDSAWKTDR